MKAEKKGDGCASKHEYGKIREEKRSCKIKNMRLNDYKF